MLHKELISKGIDKSNIICKRYTSFEIDDCYTAKDMYNDIKKEMIEKSAEDFQKLNEDSKMFILGYMVGIQQERLKQNPDDKIKEK